MVSALRTAILALSPYLYWPLDELSGLVAVDISGNNRNGTYTAAVQQGVAGVPGDTGTAITFFPQPGAAPFKGITRAGVADSGHISFVFCFENHVTSFGASEVPFSWLGFDNEGYYAQFNSASQTFNAIIGALGGQHAIADPESLANFQNHWNIAVITWDATAPAFSLYVNGALTAQTTSISLHGTPPSTDLALGFFNYHTGELQPYTGNLAHFAVIPSTLTYAQVQGLFTASGVGVPALGNIQQQTLVGAYPTTYTLGTAVTGLTGSGTIAVPNLFGAWVQLTTVPAHTGFTWETPTHWIPGQGRIMWSDLNGDDEGEIIHMNSQLVWSHNRTNQFLRYTFRTGVVATITPITVP